VKANEMKDVANVSADNETTACPGTKLNGAYDALKADCNADNCASLLQALEDDLCADSVVWLPVNPKGTCGKAEIGEIEWCVSETPQGVVLSAYTSEEMVRLHNAPYVAIVRLSAVFEAIEGNPRLAGMALNPCDDNGGVVIQRVHLELVARNAQKRHLATSLDVDVLSEALLELWGNAVGVPILVVTINDEIDALGGMDRVVGPVVRTWTESIKSERFKGWSIEQLVREGARWMLETALLAGTMVKAHPERFRIKTAHDWYEEWHEEDETDIEDEILLQIGIEDFKRGAELLANMKRNLDMYFKVVEAKVGMRVKSKEAVWDALALNIGMVFCGIASFGIGWGAALYYERQGPTAIEDARRRQRAAYGPNDDER